MGDNTSLRNRTQYGFQDGDRKVYSNLPLDCLMVWMDRLKETHRQDPLTHRQEPLLETEKDLVIVNLDRHHLEHIVKELFPGLAHIKPRKELSHQYRHHTANSFVDVWEPQGIRLYGERELSPECLHQLENAGDELKMIYGRGKFRDSATEKFARFNVCKGTMGFNEKHLLPYHITALDVIALTVVGKDEEACYNLKSSIDASSHMVCLGDEKDYIAEPRNTGYRSLHQYYTWLKNTIPTGTVFEIHFETLADHPLNMHGNGTDERSHRFHGERKYKMDHDQGNNQIIILEKNGQDHEELVPVDISNRFVNYTLINY